MRPRRPRGGCGAQEPRGGPMASASAARPAAPIPALPQLKPSPVETGAEKAVGTLVGTLGCAPARSSGRRFEPLNCAALTPIPWLRYGITSGVLSPELVPERSSGEAGSVNVFAFCRSRVFAAWASLIRFAPCWPPIPIVSTDVPMPCVPALSFGATTVPRIPLIQRGGIDVVRRRRDGSAAVARKPRSRGERSGKRGGQNDEPRDLDDSCCHFDPSLRLTTTTGRPGGQGSSRCVTGARPP